MWTVAKQLLCYLGWKVESFEEGRKYEGTEVVGGKGNKNVTGYAKWCVSEKILSIDFSQRFECGIKEGMCIVM